MHQSRHRTVYALSTDGGPAQMQPSREPAPQLEPPGGVGGDWRVVIALCTLAIFICYADRSNISVAILSMAEHFHWDDGYKGTVLSVFFLGYAGTQLLGGNLADRFGGKAVLAAGVVAWSACTFVTPYAAMAGTGALISCRIAMGLGEGVAFPAVHTIISTAVPLGYQSTAVAVVTAASYGGAAVAAGASPWIIDHYGWPAVFYAFGAFALVWIPVWAITPVPHSRPSGSNASPRSPPPDAAAGALDDGEAHGETTDTARLVGGQRQDSAGEAQAGPGVLDAGFWGLVKRKEVIAICAAQYCQSWGMYALLNWLPTFFSEEYHVDITDLGKYTLVPPLLQAVVGGFSGVIADSLIVRGYSVRGTRRALQTAGMLGPAACLLLAVSPALHDNPGAAAVLVTAAQGFSALTLGAVSVSQLDIAPKHAGSIFGLGNTFGTVSGLLSTKVTGEILRVSHSWTIVFGVTAMHYVVGAAVWYAWAGGEVLPEDDLV